MWSGPRGFVQAGAGALFQGIRGVPRDWIDTALPEGATAGSCGRGCTDRFTVNQNEFFNRSVGPVYYIGGPTPGNLPETAIAVDPDDGVLRGGDGSSADAIAIWSPTPRSRSTGERSRATSRWG